ncbi:peptide chain release factor 2 [Anaerofustis sp.]|uniref:peptide chain release factor 2 n=1 Tax=Anaerofustis sp. TaxID=1872517 RepID=UPI0025B9A412|nr:peptide chain release factor 2 [Anaerofustis sp.]
MAELTELKNLLNDISKELDDISKSIDIPTLKESLIQKENLMNDENFWNESEQANKVLKEIKTLKSQINKFTSIENKKEDMNILIEMLEDEFTESDASSTMQELNLLKKELQSFVIDTLLSGEYDSNNAILSIHPGAGGTESQDWAEMLYRMFLRFAEKRKFKIKILEELSGDVAGIKSVTMLLKGENAYGYLKGEKGVHRLVRISPFDSNNRRHTSFASVDVEPEINEDINLEINPSDLKIDTYRSGGAGGQHVNKTDSAVRITHLPTKIVVSCQNERSQFQNKETAMKILRGKLYKILMEEHKEKLDEIKGDYGQIAWGNQIRSYVFHPYSMVKDHRTKAETSNVQSVMDGDIDLFIDAYLKKTD